MMQLCLVLSKVIVLLKNYSGIYTDLTFAEGFDYVNACKNNIKTVLVGINSVVTVLLAHSKFQFYFCIFFDSIRKRFF